MKKNGAESASAIDAYTILKCIGVGGFSKVYLVRDKTDGTFYAAKFIEKAKLKEKNDLIMN
jgi:serum/glucocorticoid-regulated kinase 2